MRRRSQQSRGQMTLDQIRELVVDNFAGGGGASTGIALAIGRSVDIAINHDPAAIAMHKANHPETKHFCESVWEVNPRKVTAGHPVGLCWFSPDCTHFSKAKGGKPVSKKIRGLAWVAIRWAAQVRPRVIMLENVEEFTTWGPLIPARDKATGRLMKLVPREDEDGKVYDLVVSEPGEVVPPELQSWRPDPDRKGHTFKAFVNKLRKLGYHVEWKELRACDYGAPTIRKRLFLIARRDGHPVVWPEPTHGDPKSPEVKSGRLKAWRTAAEIIDWSIPCPSIFDRKRPLKENTLRRIARGLKRFVIDNPQPFIVPVTHHGSDRVASLDAPLPTVTAAHRGEFALITPFLGVNTTGHPGSSPEEPLRTVTTGDHHMLIAPHVTKFRGGATGHPMTDPLHTITSGAGATRPAGAPHALGIVTAYLDRQFTRSVGHPADEPLGTVTAGGSGKSNLVTAFLAQYHSEKASHDARGQTIDRPILTVDTSNRYGLVAASMVKHYGGGYTGPGNSLQDPLSTVTATDHNALVTSNLVKLRGTCADGQPVTEPMPTITAGGLHVGEVRAFLCKYYGSTEDGQGVDEPLHTVTSKARFGLVTIQGEDYQIVDIGMRMLEPRELFSAQGFPKEYRIERDLDGNRFSKADQVARCGNAVPPVFSEALVRANLPELCTQYDVASGAD